VKGAGRGERPRAVQARGVCPVCRSMQPLRIADGKLAKHGRSAAAPLGCPGGAQPPMRRASALGAGGGATVVGMRAGESGATAQTPRAPEVDITADPAYDVPVQRRGPGPLRERVHDMTESPDGPVAG
jgi:hypothetical protein